VPAEADVWAADADRQVENQDHSDRRGDSIDPTPTGDHKRRTEDAEDRPRCTDRERIGAQQKSPERTAEQSGDVHGDEAGGANPRLKQPAEKVEREHVEADVDKAGVEE